jgi:hypothetical protein
MGWATWIQFPAGSGIFLSASISILYPGPTHPPVSCVPEAVSPRVLKRSVMQTNHLHLCRKLCTFVCKQECPCTSATSSECSAVTFWNRCGSSGGLVFHLVHKNLSATAPTGATRDGWGYFELGQVMQKHFVTSLQDKLVQIAYSLHVLIQLI